MKKSTRSIPAVLLLLALVFLPSCTEDWGQSDPAAGTQIYPTLKSVGTIDLDAGFDTLYQVKPGPDGTMPAIESDTLINNVLSLNGGAISIDNGIEHAESGVSISMWVKQTDIDKESVIWSFDDENGNKQVSFTAGGQLVSDEFSSEIIAEANSFLVDDTWAFIGVVVERTGIKIYSDGELISSVEQDLSSVVDKMVVANTMSIGDVNETETFVDKVTVYRNTATDKEFARPSTNGSSSGSDDTPIISFPPVYFNDFESGLGTAVIEGTGTIENIGDVWGNVFSNATGGMRTNYLRLPEDVLSHSKETKALSIGCWVNRGNETTSSAYMWSPLFTAYGAGPATENTFPMFACQYRGVLQVNNAGWSDFVDANNDNGANTLYHDGTDWLADGEWHYYTATFTETSAKVYFDGELKNSWTLDGTSNGQVISGLFSNGADLKWICLGGNQAWNWGDPDPGFWFDDIAIWNCEVAPEHIEAIMLNKKAVYFNDFTNGLGDATIQGGGKVEFSDDTRGNVFSNATGGMRANYLLLPEDALSHSAETNEMTIGCWVNRGNETTSSAYMWSPLFMAYGAGPATENTFPMFACQYRGVLQVNNAGWCDFVDANNDNGANTLYHDGTDWLADGEWHYYTATFTKTSAKVYFDGELKNSWTLDGTSDGQVISGLFSNGADLKWICLGGNQAWNWGDPDPGFWFDNIAIWNKALSEDEIKVLVRGK